jgi:hypothetical protein
MLMQDIEVKVYHSAVKIPVIFFVPAACVLTLYVLIYLGVNSQWFGQELTERLTEELPGTFAVEEIAVSPSLTRVQVFNVKIDERDGRDMITAGHVDAEVSPLLLLARRIHVDRAKVVDLRFDMRFVNDTINVLDAIGLKDDGDDDEDDTDSPIQAVTLSNLTGENISYSLDLEFMRFEVPHGDIPHGEVSIDDGILLMNVPSLDVATVDFVFQPSLFRFPKNDPKLAVSATDVKFRNWQWTDDGFAVESLSFNTSGNTAFATGRMSFPDSPDGEARMEYAGRGVITAATWSPAAHYFLRDNVHVGGAVDIGVIGTLEEIEGGARLNIPYAEAADLRATNLVGDLSLDDSTILFRDVTGDLYGGQMEIESGFFNMFTLLFGGVGTVTDVDPAAITADLGFDFPYLEGKATGSFSATGMVPLDRVDYRPGEPLALVEAATVPIVNVDLTSDLEYRRTGVGVLPGDYFRIRRGARLYAFLDRIGIPRATVDTNDATIRVNDFIFDWQRYELMPGQRGEPAQINIVTDDLATLTRHYGTTAVSGPFKAEIKALGRINYPRDLRATASVERPRITVGDEVIEGESLATELTLKNGEVDVQKFDFRSPRGDVDLAGSLEVLRNPKRIIDPENNRPTTDFVYPRGPSADLRFGFQRIDLSLASEFVPVDVSGRGWLEGTVKGDLDDPLVDVRAQTSDVTVAGQPLKRLEFDGEIQDRQLKLTSFELDAGTAGQLDATATVGFDGTYEFDASGRRIALEAIRPLSELGVPVEGTADFRLHGDGSLDKPQIGGDARLNGFEVYDRKVGDVALIVNTLDDTIHVVGAMVPWITVDAEIPLDGESPFYARFGVDHLDIRETYPEIAASGVVEGAEITGDIEVFLDPDFKRYQILANVTDFEMQTVGQTFRNKGTVIVGFNNGELLQVQQAVIGTDDRFVSLQGGVALDQSLVDLQIKGDLDLALLNGVRSTFPEFFPESFLESSGLARVDANLRGTPENLIADGFIEFNPTEILLRDLPEPVTILSGTVLFDRGGIRIDREAPIRGRALGGLYSATGRMSFENLAPKSAIVKVWTHNMSYRVPEVANLTFDTELELNVRDFNRPDTWSVSGEVEILDGLYYEQISIFQRQLTDRIVGAFSRTTEQYEASILDTLPLLEEITFDVALKARDGFRIQNEIDRLALDLELRIGLRIQNTLVDPRLTGDIDVIDGKVTFQGEQFEVRSGTVSFFGEAANPNVDIIADADIQNRCRQPDVGVENSDALTLTGVVETDEQQTYRVVLNVRGALDNLNIEFNSNPYADQRDILSLLLTGCTVDQLTASSASSPTLEVALGPVLGWIEGQVQNAVQVEEFTITPSVDRLKTVVGDSFTRRLSWRFQLDTGLTEATGGQRAELEYKLSDQWSMEASESRRTDTGSFLIDWKLKYRHFLD